MIWPTQALLSSSNPEMRITTVPGPQPKSGIGVGTAKESRITNILVNSPIFGVVLPEGGQRSYKYVRTQKKHTRMIFYIVNRTFGDFELSWVLRSGAGNVRPDPKYSTSPLFVVTLLNDTVRIEGGRGIA